MAGTTGTLGGFEHEAVLYAGDEDFVDRSASFVRAGVTAGEPVMVMVPRRRLDMLREALGADAEPVRFVDMEDAGRNPGRIIPAWRRFADSVPPGRGARGIGEPIWDRRSADELVECQSHEALLNVAFADADGFRLLCPYDVSVLDDAVIEQARCSHPLIVDGDVRWASTSYQPPAATAALELPLAPPPADASELAFELETLAAARALVRAEATAAGVAAARVDDLVLAAGEAVANSVRHGGGRGVVRVWIDPAAVVCEVIDAGRIADPLVGRTPPPPGATNGQGLWLAHQLCDLLQLRSRDGRTVVRLHVRR